MQLRRIARLSESPSERRRALRLARRWKTENPDRNQATKRAWEARNPEKVSAYARKSSAKFRRANIRLVRRRVLASKAKKGDYYRNQTRSWAAANPGKCRAKYKKYMTSKLNAVPLWADHAMIEKIYDRCAKRNAKQHLGLKWHVDHIVPLQSSLVCGLHVHYNLRIVPSTVNTAKGNRRWPGMPELLAGGIVVAWQH
jgi:hypothetical protein